MPAGAAACPECGSDEKTGWNEEGAVYDGTGIEEPKEFKYEEWLEKEGVEPRRASVKQIIIIIVALLVIVALAAFLLRK